MSQDAQSPAVSIRGLSKSFGDLRAVDGLDLTIEKGEIFGLVGPDGAGKTTTLRLLCGLAEPSAGSAQVAGCDLASQSDAIKDRIGYMSQRFGLYLDLSVEENMSFYADLFGLPARQYQELSARLLEMTRLAPFSHRPAGKLSGGMKQKLALSCALLHKPQILFLDEPTNGVDPVSRRDFWKILYELVKERITVLITTAYLDEAERCNRVGLMHRGRLIECDTPERLLKSVREKFYQVRCADSRAARQALLDEPGVLSAEPSGAALNVFMSPELPGQRLQSLLEEKRLDPVEVSPMEPALEDVFIALIRRQKGTP